MEVNVKLNVVNRNYEVVKQYIFIGSVPPGIKKALTHIETTNSISKNIGSVLAKHYGKQYKKILSIEFLHDGKVHGGDDMIDDTTDDTSNNQITDDFEFDDVIGEDIDFNINEEHELTGDIKESLLKESSHADDTTEQDDIEGTSADPLIDKKKIPKVEKHMTGAMYDKKLIPKEPITTSSTRLKFIELPLYMEDNIMSFKHKIRIATGIPVYRQHLWYCDNSNLTHQMCYEIYNDNGTMDFDIRDIMSVRKGNNILQSRITDLISGIPIDVRYYNQKNKLIVRPFETFNIMRTYYNQGVTTFNVIDLNTFMPPRTVLENMNDKYSIDMIYYGFIFIYWPIITRSVYKDYLNNEKSLSYYPILHPSLHDIDLVYKSENEIISEQRELFNDKKELNNIRSMTSSSITYAVLSILTTINISSKNISLRNLFDLFELSPNIPWSSLIYKKHHDSRYVITKKYNNDNGIDDVITMTSVVFKVIPDIKYTSYYILTIYPNLNYTIKAKFREEKKYGFDDIYNNIFQVINNIISKINSFGDKIMYMNSKMSEMTSINTKITETNNSIYCKKMITTDEFGNIKKILSKFVNAKIISDKEIHDSSLQYYFSKGMFQHDPMRIDKQTYSTNYYEYMTNSVIQQKWSNVFEKTRVTIITHRFTDIRVDIIGIREEEYPIYYNFIMTLFYMFNKSLERGSKTQMVVYKNKLKQLRIQDPILYDFKKIYKSNIIYAKKCQKQYQPVIINSSEYETLTPEQQKNTTMYWNFTTNEPVRYRCPNPKYPYIKFIIKEHPKDFCIPCCQKTPSLESKQQAKLSIYNTCMKDHIFTEEKRTITKGSKYVASYGKDVELNRLSKLPDISLEPLFYETYSKDKRGQDPICVNADGYFLYGTQQNSANASDIGALYSISHALDIKPHEMCEKIIKLMNNDRELYHFIINGRMSIHFADYNEFTKNLMILTSDDADIDFNDKIPWNDIIIDIANLILDIRVVLFIEKDKQIYLDMMNVETSTTDIISKKKYLFLLRKNNKIYPIYLININIFFKLGIIEARLFSHDSNIVHNVNLIYIKHKRITKGSDIALNKINLKCIRGVIKKTQYKIHSLFVNKSGCYGVLVYHKSSTRRKFFIPVQISHYTPHGEEKIIYKPLDRKTQAPTVVELFEFISTFNSEVDKVGRDVDKIIASSSDNTEYELKRNSNPDMLTIYNKIKIDFWLSYEGKYMGFVYHDVSFYVYPYTIKEKMVSAENYRILSSYDVPTHNIIYDLDDVNKKIYRSYDSCSNKAVKHNSKSLEDSKCKVDEKMKIFRDKLSRSLYNYYLYRLFITEFMKYITKERNIAMRKDIENIITNNKRESALDKLKKLLLGDIDPDDIDHNSIPKYNDYIKLQKIIERHKSSNKKHIITEIKDAQFNFDMYKFEILKTKDMEHVRTEIRKICKKIIHVGDIQNIKHFTFNNIFGSCSDIGDTQVESETPSSCQHGKLIMKKEIMDEYIDILSSDIINHMKQKWIFNNLLVDPVVQFFKFKYRPGEKIYIEIVDD